MPKTSLMVWVKTPLNNKTCCFCLILLILKWKYAKWFYEFCFRYFTLRYKCFMKFTLKLRILYSFLSLIIPYFLFCYPPHDKTHVIFRAYLYLVKKIWITLHFQRHQNELVLLSYLFSSPYSILNADCSFALINTFINLMKTFNRASNCLKFQLINTFAEALFLKNALISNHSLPRTKSISRFNHTVNSRIQR